MPGFRVNMDVAQKGKVFDAAQTRAAGRRMVVKINEAIALEGVRRVKARLKEVLRNPTGYYESRIAVERRETYRGVWDSRVVYGSWLEGTSSRNKTTRFKGYGTFRMIRQSLEKDKTRLAEPIVASFVREINGGE